MLEVLIIFLSTEESREKHQNTFSSHLSFFSPFPVRPQKKSLYWKNLHPSTEASVNSPGVSWRSGKTQISCLKLVHMLGVMTVLDYGVATEWDMWVMM